MDNPIVYIFANKGLKMSPGKLASQVAHAVIIMSSNEEQSELKLWKSTPHKTIIVLEARDENHIRNIRQYLLVRGYNTYDVIDEGVNEIDKHTITALSTEILEKDNEDVIKTFSSFDLYTETIKINMEIKL